MTNKFTAGLLITSLITVPGFLCADNSTANPVTHPEVAYDQHMVNSNEKEVNKDGMKATEMSQAAKEQKERMEQAKKDYEKSLSDLGANNDVTKQAKSRYDSAKKDYMKLVKKHGKAMHEMHEDQQDLNKAQADLQKNKAEAAQ